MQEGGKKTYLDQGDDFHFQYDKNLIKKEHKRKKKKA